MAKKIRQIQVESLSEDLSALNNKKVKSIGFTGTTTKTLRVTFDDDTFIESTFNDLNTTYAAMTAQLLNDGVDTAERTVQAKILVDYINSRLSSVFVYKGTVPNFGALPPSNNKIGDSYNVGAAFMLDGVNQPAGTNVAWNGTGWDALAGVIDTSAFLTAETDPKGVKSVAVTGTGTKTITITLRDDTVITGTFTDDNTTYATGTLELLNTGTETTGKLWTAKDIADFVKAFQITVKHELTTVTAGMIVSGKVNITPSTTITDKNRAIVFLNGIKQPVGAQAMSGSILQLTQTSLPTPVLATDEIEIFYL